MYHNVGKKIKTLAKILALIETVFCILGGIAIITFGLIMGHEAGLFGLSPTATIITSIAIGLALALLGSLNALIQSWLLYGQGEMIDKLTDVEINTRGNR